MSEETLLISNVPVAAVDQIWLVMVDYACDFNQSVMEKYFEQIIIAVISSLGLKTLTDILYMHRMYMHACMQ